MTKLRAGAVLPTAALLLVTSIWGSTFFLIKDLIRTIPPLDFLGTRFAIAAVVVLVFRFPLLRNAPLRTWKRGVVLGAIYSLGQILQTTGLETTSASISGFLTGLYVVFTPLLVAGLFRKPISGRVWIAVILATAGLGSLSLKGFSLGSGEALTILGAGAYAAHIVFVSRWAAEELPAQLAYIQVISTGVILGLTALPGGVTLPTSAASWAVLLYMALVAGLAVALLQTWAQSKLSATTAAVIMTTEPLFATAFAVALGGESLTLRLIAGGLLIVTAMLLVQTKAAGKEGLPEATSRRHRNCTG